jgi:uncharacterized protein YidB (DUF937 family)
VSVDKILGGLLGGGGRGGGLDVGAILSGLGGGRSTVPAKGGALNPQMLMALLPLVLGLLKGGGLERILGGMRAKGFTAEADSYVGTGENRPLTGSQVREVVGEDEVSRIAGEAGVSEAEAADGIAQLLPGLIDKASPDGRVAPRGDIDDAFSQLQRSAAGR